MILDESDGGELKFELLPTTLTTLDFGRAIIPAAKITGQAPAALAYLDISRTALVERQRLTLCVVK